MSWYVMIYLNVITFHGNFDQKLIMSQHVIFQSFNVIKSYVTVIMAYNFLCHKYDS